ncbi:Glutathione transport system permease protein GsiD [subsurface metagenome]
MCLPGLIVLIILVSIMGASLWSIIIAVGINWGIIGSRVIRGAVIGIKENVYVQAAEVIGCSTPRILIRHILPNVMATLIVLLSVRVPAIILAEASLSFLGFGIPPPFPSWGGMLSGTGRNYMFLAPWLAVWPGLAIAITVYAVNVFGDAVRDITDPRLRGGIGRYGVRVKKAKGGDANQSSTTE